MVGLKDRGFGLSRTLQHIQRIDIDRHSAANLGHPRKHLHERIAHVGAPRPLEQELNPVLCVL